MQGKKPFKLAWKLLLIAGIITIAYTIGLKNTWIGNWLKNIIIYGFMIILIGALLTYLNWSEAKRRL